MEKVRIAIIGIGAMGKKYALQIFQNQVDNMELAAIVCRNEPGRNWAREQFDEKVKLFSSSDELFEHTEYFDGVLIVTPHKEHPRLAKEAFSKGIHVFSDKPAGIYTKEVREMNQAAKKAGVAFAMMFHKRTIPIYRYVKEMLEKGELGDLNRVTWVSTKSFRTKKYHQSSAWRSSWKGEGGGLLMNQAQHPLDLWQWFFGMPVNVLGLVDFGKYNDFKVDDNSTLLMEYENGMRGMFISSTGEGTGEERVEIVGTAGRVILEENTLKYWNYTMPMDKFMEINQEQEAQIPYIYKEREFENYANPYIAMLENFADHILNKTPLIVKGEDGINALELANAAYLSAWENKKISIPIEDDIYYEALQEKIAEEEK
ncbi:MAG: Gfo/Idh/MocA family oxidoreductase [Clostridiales bacterium]|nr:Gfo/Idh/MocA family oxidoreductase [Clostridiales bacterium]